MYGCLWVVWSTWSAIDSRFPRVASLTSSLSYCRVRTRAPIFGSVALPTRVAAGEHGLAVVDSLRLPQFWWCFVSDGMARRDSRKIFVSGLKQLGRTQITILSERASCRSAGHRRQRTGAPARAACLAGATIEQQMSHLIV